MSKTINSSIILGLFFLPLFLKAQAPAPTDSVKLKVLTWNIQMLPDMLGMFSHSLRKKQTLRINWIIEHLKTSPADIIVLQEVFDVQMHRKLRRQLKKVFPYQVQPLKRNKLWFWRQNSGVMFLSKIPIKQIGSTVYKAHEGIDGMADKGFTLVEGTKDGHTFQIGGTHLQAGGRYETVRDSQCRQLAQKVLHPVRKTGIPQILVGDLNTRDDGPAYHTMLQTLDMQDAPLQDPQPYSVDGNNSWDKGDSPERIDYVLIHAMQTKTSIIHEHIERIYRIYKGERMDYADHYGVFAIIHLN